ncbi:MAG: hypothetical protein JWN57_1943 [Frankiales bacterium]|nr:hypothetical protein [Frankiales bacterium]
MPAPSRKAPTNSSPATGSSAIRVVFTERMNDWLRASSEASVYVVALPPAMPRVFSCTLSKMTTAS